MNLGTAEASPGITSSQATSLAKMLQAEFTKFSSDSSHSFADDTNTTGRKTLPAQGPTQCLSCDKMLQMEIERMAVSKKEATATTTHQDDDDPTVLDRGTAGGEVAWQAVQYNISLPDPNPPP